MPRPNKWATNAFHNAAVKNAAKKGNEFKPWTSSNKIAPYVNPTGPLEPFNSKINYTAPSATIGPYVNPTLPTFEEYLKEVQQKNPKKGGLSRRNNRRKKRTIKRSKRCHSRRK